MDKYTVKMSKITVQDIEAVDDYWGPTFRSILEGKKAV